MGTRSKKNGITRSAKSLSALIFCMGAGQLASAESIKIQALELLKENRISYDEFQQLVTNQSGGGVDGSYISAGNYASYISDGNYANYISAGNYADYISDGNYANYISAGNYGALPDANIEAMIPSPEVTKK